MSAHASSGQPGTTSGELRVCCLVSRSDACVAASALNLCAPALGDTCRAFCKAFQRRRLVKFVEGSPAASEHRAQQLFRFAL